MTECDARRAFGRELLLAIALCCAQYLISMTYEIGKGSYDVYVAFENSRLFSHLAWVAPVLAALPFATSFCSDWRSGSLTMQMLRSGRKRYVVSKMLCTAISGGAAFALGLLVFFLVILPFGHMNQYQAAFESVEGMMSVLLAGKPALYLAGLVLLQGLEGAYYAMTALAFSAFCPNRYLVLCFPMFTYRLNWAALGLFPNHPYWLNLGMLGSGEVGMAFWPTLGVGFAVFLPLIGLCAVIFAVGTRRRLEHG